jgi:type IV secretion system protein VirB2
LGLRPFVLKPEEILIVNKSVVLALVAFLLLLSLDAHAAGAGSTMPWDGPLNQMRASITGPVAFAIALFGIVGSGAALIFVGGEISAFLRQVLYLVLVIAVIVFANDILTRIGVSGAVITVAEV